MSEQSENNNEEPKLLGLKQKSDSLYKQITEHPVFSPTYDPKQDNSLFGLFGSWGTGKTTLLQSVAPKLENEGYTVVWFKPWEFFDEDKDVDKKILQAIRDSNRSVEYSSYSKWVTFSFIVGFFLVLAPYFYNLIRYSMPWFAQALVIGLLLSVLPLIFKKLFYQLTQVSINLGFSNVELPVDSFLKEIKRYDITSEKIRSDYQELVFNNNTSRKIVVMVDDLDRCKRETVINLLEHIKHFYSLPNILFVCAMSQKTLATYIQEHYQYSDDGLQRGYEYIDKLFQDPYRLINTKEDFSHYLGQRYQVQGFDTKLLDIEKTIFNDLLWDYTSRNLRKVDAIINKFGIIYKKLGYAKLISLGNSENIFIDHLFRALLLREFYPEEYEFYDHGNRSKLIQELIPDRYQRIEKNNVVYRPHIVTSIHDFNRIKDLISVSEYKEINLADKALESLTKEKVKEDSSIGFTRYSEHVNSSISWTSDSEFEILKYQNTDNKITILRLNK